MLNETAAAHMAREMVPMAEEPGKAPAHVRRTLIVEDDDDLRSLLVEAMSEADYPAFGVSSVQEYRSKAADQRWDLAIIDVNLPDGSGYAISRELRKSSDARIIILTGRGDLVDRLESYTAGCDAHLVKPAHLSELLAIARTLLSRRDEGTVQAAVWRLDGATAYLSSPLGRKAKLRPRECALMERLMATPGAMLSNDDALEVVSFGSKDLSLSGLKMLLSRLRQRVLKDTGEALPVETIPGRGLIYRAHPVEPAGDKQDGD